MLLTGPEAQHEEALVEEHERQEDIYGVCHHSHNDQVAADE